MPHTESSFVPGVGTSTTPIFGFIQYYVEEIINYI